MREIMIKRNEKGCVTDVANQSDPKYTDLMLREGAAEGVAHLFRKVNMTVPAAPEFANGNSLQND